MIAIRSRTFALAGLATAASLIVQGVACTSSIEPTDEDLTLTLNPEEVGAGLDTLVVVTVTTDEEDEGLVLVQAQSGRFDSKNNASAFVGRLEDGELRVLMRPPVGSGRYVVSATGAEAKVEKVLSVTPAPAPELVGLPDSVQTGEQVVIEVLAEEPWRLRPVSLETTHGRLEVLGAADSALADGMRVRPVLNSEAKATVQWTAPTDTVRAVLTATLFSSSSSQSVRVVLGGS